MPLSCSWASTILNRFSSVHRIAGGEGFGSLMNCVRQEAPSAMEDDHVQQRLFSNPQRLAYLLGCLITISAGIHWFVFFKPGGAAAQSFSRPPAHFHSLQMLYTSFSFFALGYLAGDLIDNVNRRLT